MQVDQSVKNIIKEYKQLLSSKYSLDKVFIFGSQVNGLATEDSDIDVCIVSKDYDGILEQMDLDARRARRKLDLRIEPHIYHTKDFKKSNLFVDEILENAVEV